MALYRTRSVGIMVFVTVTVGMVLACSLAGVTTTRGPTWACPSPTPRPWGTAGPVKTVVFHPLPTVTPSGPQQYWEEYIYYEQWEQEYPQAPNAPPFPSPTPYAKVGVTYVFGQRVRLTPQLFALVTADAGPVLTEMPSAQLYMIHIGWMNTDATPIPLSYAQRIRLRAITTPDGAVLSDSHWQVSARAFDRANLSPPPDHIPPGISQITLPVIAPPGNPETVEIEIVSVSQSHERTPTRTTSRLLAVQWQNAVWLPPGAEPCADPGALTDWDNTNQGWGIRQVGTITVPDAVPRVVQIALNQVGKPYIWGAKGPEAFDCSGLCTWSYAQAQMHIPHGTAGQWPLSVRNPLHAVDGSAIRPGDLVYMNTTEPQTQRITHVMMLVGDLNGNGRWDVVHAASPPLGVRVDYDIFDSRYFAPRIIGFRTVQTGGSPP